MGKKKTTLPKDFNELIILGDILALKDVFTKCDINSRGGYYKSTALGFFKIPDELVCWLVEQGADINASDKYGRTPLHEHAQSWCGNVELFIELGADIEALDYHKETPLFAAAASFKPKAVKILVEKGSNINAENTMKLKPLEKALEWCRNANIVNMAEVADILLKAGTTVTPKMKESVARIGQDFEFHRDGFNKDYLKQTDEALYYLYEQFNVMPVERRKVHDGVSQITITTEGWQAQHNELWKLLIPSRGHAKTIQGEVIRITGKIAHEILDNGGVNWDNQYRKMLSMLRYYFDLGTPLDIYDLEEVLTLVKKLHNGYGSDEPERLCELAVNWVINNPSPIILEQPNYQR